MESLTQIQALLKAPKNQYNKFGGYKYRSCEDILEALKPLLATHGATLTLSDDIIMIADRVYVKATATIKCGQESETVTAFAREPLDKKGMDASQITGTASSYARKYALNGLFLIDDAKDADTDEYHEQTNQQDSKQKQEQPKLASRQQIDEINELLSVTGSDRSKMLAFFKVNDVPDMTDKSAKACIAMLKKKL